MPYPIFSQQDIINTNTKHGDSDVSDFLGYLDDLITHKQVIHSTGVTVIKHISTEGTDSLNLNQTRVLKRIMNKHGLINCEKCGCKIPWNELFEAYNNGGYCNPCDNQNTKDD